MGQMEDNILARGPLERHERMPAQGRPTKEARDDAPTWVRCPRARAALILDVVRRGGDDTPVGLDSGSHSKPLTRHHGCDIEGTSRAGGLTIVEPDEQFSDLLTTWEPGTPIIFRNEWDGHTFEQKGTVLEFTPESRVRYSLFFPRPDLQDIPEHYFFMTYELSESGEATSLLIRQEDPRPSAPDESPGGDDGPDVLSHLKELVEVKMK
jgi:hypothetical protein